MQGAVVRQTSYASQPSGVQASNASSRAYCFETIYISVFVIKMARCLFVLALCIAAGAAAGASGPILRLAECNTGTSQVFYNGTVNEIIAKVG